MARSVTSQLVVELLDRVSEPARRMQESLGGITQSVRDANSQRVDFGQRIDAAITRNNRAIDQTRGRMIDAAAGAYMLARGLSAPVRVAADFEQGMNRVRVLTDATDEQFERMSTQARELGRTTMFSATEATQGMGFLAQAGFEADQIVGALPGTLQLAAAGQMDLASAADIASNVLSGYRLDVEELSHVNDVMAATFTSTNTNLAQLGEAMSYAAPFAASAGVEFEEASAAIGLLGSAGIQGSRAGSALGQSINRMLNPTGQMRDEMEELGLSFTDSEGKLLPLVDVVRQLEEHSEDAGLMARLFGQRAGPAMAALVGMGADALEELRDGMDDVGGTAERIAGVEMEGFNGRVRAMRSAMEGLQLVIGNALLPVLTGMVNVLTDLAQPLAGLIEQYPQITAAVIGLTTSVIAFRIAAIGARFIGLHLKGALLALAAPAWRAAAGVGALAAAIVATTWGTFAAGLARARRGMIAFAAAVRIGGIGAALTTVGASALAMLNPLRLLRRGLALTTAAMRVLTGAVIGTGIGAVLVGIGLAGAWIYRNWAGIKEAFEGFREGFNAAIEPVRPALEPVIGLFETLFDWIGRLTEPLDASAEDWREWGRNVGETVGNFVVAVMEIPERVGDAIRASIAWFGALYDRASDSLADLWAGFEAWWDGLVAYSHEQGAALREAGAEVIGALWDGMRERYSGLLEWARGWTSDIAAQVQSDGLLATGAGLIDAMLRGMISAAADLVEWAALLPARIIDSLLGTDLAGPGRDMIQGLRRGIAERFNRLLDWTGRWSHEMAERIEADGLRGAGVYLLQSLSSGMRERAVDLLEWVATLPLRVIDAIAGTDLAPQGREFIRSLRRGIAERFAVLLEWATSWPGEIAEQVSTDGLLVTGADLMDSILRGMISAAADLFEWTATIPLRIVDRIAGTSLADTGRDMIRGLREGISERFDRLVAWSVRWPHEIAAQIAEDGLLDTGRDLLQSLWDGMAELIGGLLEWVGGIPGEIAELIAETDLARIGADIIQSLWDGMVRKFNDLIAWVRNIPSVIREAIGNIDLSDIIQWPQRPEWLGGTSGSANPNAGPAGRLDGARRRGGPISAGGSYLVGEEEPEIVTPTRSGYVHPLSKITRHIISSGGDEQGHVAPLILDAPDVAVSAEVQVNRGGEDRPVHQDFHVTITPTIHVDGDAGRDPRATADEVARQMERAVREAFRGVMADTGMRTV